MVRSDGLQPTSFAVEPQELEDLKLDAKAEGVSVSQYIRKIIKNRNAETGTLHRARGQIPEKKELAEEEKKENLEREKAAFQEVYREEKKQERIEAKLIEMIEKLNAEVEELKKKCSYYDRELPTYEKNIRILNTRIPRKTEA